MQFVKDHPWWTALGVLFALGAVLTYWYIIAAGMGVMAIVEYRRDRTIRRDALLARAEYEHRLEMQGDTRGLHGQYPPTAPNYFHW